MPKTNPQERPPSFFKVIRYPSAPHLTLPKAFVRSYQSKIPRNPIIVTETGEHSWKLEFVKIGDDYCFAHGWEKLAKDAELGIRDIVVFWLVDHKTFHVSFLGANGCVKFLPVNKTNDDDQNLCFEKVISRRTYRYHLNVPIKFVRAAGLEHVDNIVLKDHKGKEWNIGILAERLPSRVRYHLTRGWANFRRHHKLSDGDVCKFTFDKKEGVLNLTQVVRNKRPIKEEPIMNVKVEDDWDWFPSRKPFGAGGGAGGGNADVEVKIEDGLDGSSPGTVVGKRKRELEKPSSGCGVETEVNTESLMDRAFRSKHVVYF